MKSFQAAPSYFAIILMMMMMMMMMTDNVRANETTTTCSIKTARTEQRKQLGKLSEDHVVVEAKYYNKYTQGATNIYRFLTQEVWPTYNGSLKIDKYIHVHISADQKPEKPDCYARLRFDRSYFLILKQLNNVGTNDEKHFQSLVSPVTKFRRTIYKSLCRGDSCPTRIVLPADKTLFNNQMKMIPCRVQTSLKATEYTVEWVHKNKVVESQPDKTVQTARDEDGNLGLVIMRGTVEDAGNYTCRVTTNEGAQVYEQSVEVDIFDPLFEKCDQSYCNNQGTCYKNKFNGFQFCHCNPGTTGKECTDYGMPPSESSVQDDTEVMARLRNLTVIVATFCVLVVIATVVATFHAHRIKKLIEKFMKSRRGVRKIVKKSLVASSTSSLPTPRASNNSYTAVSVTPARSIE